MKRLIGLLSVVLLLVAIPASHLVFGKAHVRVGKVQVCHKGKTITISAKALKAHLKHGDCQLPACDFNNVFQTGDPCRVIVESDGRCGGLEPRASAEGVTDACPAGTF